MDENLKRAYADILQTEAGIAVLKDMLSKFQLFGSVYDFQGIASNELSNLAFRDGQRNSGSYIYQNMIASNPEKTSQIQASIFKDMIESKKDIIDSIQSNREDD